MKLFSSSKKTSLSSDVVILSTSLMVTCGFYMLTSMLLSRYRTLEEYGTYSQLLMVINLFTMLLTLGLPSSINFFLARADTPLERNRFISIYYIINTVIGLTVGTILLVGIPLIELYFNNSMISKFGYFLALYPWTKIIISSVDNLLIVQKQTKVLFVYGLLHSLSLVGTVLLIQWLDLGFYAYIPLNLAVEMLFSFIAIAIAMKLDGRIHFQIDWQQVKTILAFSVPLGLSVAITTLNAELDKFVIGRFFSTEQYAIYANAAKELPFNFIGASITAVLLPVITRRIKRGRMTEAVDLWKECIIVSFLINAFFAFGLFTYSKDAIVFLYSEKYAPGAAVFAIYSLLILFRSVNFGTILQCTSNTKYIMRSSAISLVLNLVLNVALYYVIGFEGPAVATVLTMLWNSLYLLRVTRRITGIPLKQLFPWKSVATLLVVNLAFSAVFFALKRIVPLERLVGESWESIFLAGVWALAYFGVFSKFIRKKMKLIKSFEPANEGEAQPDDAPEPESMTAEDDLPAPEEGSE